MNTNMKRVISGIAALGIALSGMALGASSAWADQGQGGSNIPAGNVKIDSDDSDVTGAIAINAEDEGHSLNGYRLGYLTSISYGEITDANNASISGYTLETNRDYKDAIETALAAITDSNAKGDAAQKTLKDRYLADENYCGSDCQATGDPNPLGWFLENYGKGYEGDAPWGGDAKDGSSATVLRKFATEVSKALSNAAATYSGNSALTPTGEDLDVLPGYYLLRDVTTLGKDNAETQSAPILVSSTYIVTIGEAEVTFNKDAQGQYLGAVSLKNYTPTITKEVVTDKNGTTAQNQPDYAVDDTVYYKLTADLPYYTGYAANATDPSKGRVYKITDTASKGLTVGDDAVVSVKVTPATGSSDTAQDLVATKDYAVSFADNAAAEAPYKDGKTTTIDFANYVNLAEGTKSKAAKILEGGTVTVIFKATLNNDALISDSGEGNIKPNPNKDSLTYSNEPENVQETHTTPGDEVNVYTYRFRLHKTDKAGEALSGAKFVVKAPEGNDGDWLQWDATASAWKHVAEANATVFTSNNKGEVVATVDGATVNLDRLDSGTYTVKETEAPTGYTQAFLPTFTFTITPTMGNEADGHKTITDVTFSAADGNGKAYVTKSAAITDGADKDAWQYTIYNAKNLTELPMTGGAGLVAVIAAGVLLAGAGVAAAVRSRKSNSRAVRI